MQFLTVNTDSPQKFTMKKCIRITVRYFLQEPFVLLNCHPHTPVMCLNKQGFFFLPRCAVITEFARELLVQRGVKLVVPGEQDRVVVSLGEEEVEEEKKEEEKNGADEPAVTATVGEKCEV